MSSVERGRGDDDHQIPPSAYELVEHLRRHATDDERVLDAIAHTPRERFVAAHLEPYAYEDTALPTEAGQTISQPTIVAMMTAALELAGDERVLDVGTGSAYQAAILARLSEHVVTVEVVDSLRLAAEERLQSLGIQNVTVLPAGEELGAPDLGPYDAILVAAAAPAVPPSLLEQLAPGGRLVVPVGTRAEQELVRVIRGANADRATFEEDRMGACRFVPLVGPEGFSDESDPEEAPR